jgi:hypothetical protein
MFSRNFIFSEYLAPGRPADSTRPDAPVGCYAPPTNTEMSFAPRPSRTSVPHQRPSHASAPRSDTAPPLASYHGPAPCPISLQRRWTPHRGRARIVATRWRKGKGRGGRGRGAPREVGAEALRQAAILQSSAPLQHVQTPPIYFWNIEMQQLQHTSEGRWNTWNMLLKQLKNTSETHLKTIATIHNIWIKYMRHAWNIYNIQINIIATCFRKT